MTQQPYELLARFNADGTVKGVHVRTITTVNGREYESDPVPLAGADDPAFIQFAQAFSASVVAERDLLQQKVNELQDALPWNPRVLEASKFVARITANEMFTLASSTDQTIKSIFDMLQQWIENDWPVVLDSPEMQQSIQYLQQEGIVTQERVGELLRDCTKDEAFVADGN